jgi:uncharacterized repeat protein (TIGR03803 family)
MAHHRSRFILALVIALAASFPSPAQTFRLLYTFTGGTDGGNPWDAPLLHDGMLYGTTWQGGINDYGVIYQLDIHTGAETVLHTFQGGTTDGAKPDAGLTRDAAGNLYGVTDAAGTYNSGTAFQLQPSGNLILSSFTGANGGGPQTTLVGDGHGNYYGGAYFFGPRDNGTLFRMDPAGTITLLLAFNNVDGGGPKFGPLVLRNGDLYGTTFYGGKYNLGTIYRLNLANGKETVLHSFSGPDGAYPVAGLTADSTGNLYGTTTSGGAHEGSNCIGQAPGCGTVFKLANSDTLTTLYSFSGTGDGSGPQGAPSLDSQGNIYGTTNQGGSVVPQVCEFGCATVFKIDPRGNFTVVYTFTNSADGLGMYAGVTIGSDGTLYGSTPGGGAFNNGTIFAIQP